MKKLLQNSGLALMLVLGMSSCSKSSEWYYQVCNMQADQSWVKPGTENNTDQPFSGANADYAGTINSGLKVLPTIRRTHCR